MEDNKVIVIANLTGSAQPVHLELDGDYISAFGDEIAGEFIDGMLEPWDYIVLQK